MKSLIAPMIVTASFLTICICGFAAFTALAKPYAPHRFDHLADKMWSVEPKRVNPGQQNYARAAAVVPAPEASQDLPMPKVLGTPAANDLVAVTDVASPQTAGDTLCQQRYRSYRAADNSYQPFDGGPRRPCELASPQASVTTAQPAIRQATVADNNTGERISLCSAKYSSYNAADGTYQPFGGGSRKPCVSAMSVASN